MSTSEEDALLKGLNPVQREAVLHGEGPMLLLAGAGSGKTRVVTSRIVRLLQSGVPPWRILAVTFTNRAAAEMRERVAKTAGGEVRGLTLSTFHALGARVLREQSAYFGRTQRFTVYDDGDQKTVIKRLLDDHDLGGRKGLPAAIRRAFDQAKNAGLSASGAELSAIEFSGVDVQALGREYDRRLERADAFDFGDLILRPAELFEASPEMGAIFRARWPWVLVDEFQDTNAAQYTWLKHLSPPGANLFVVGDDDQSIYGWRGAVVANILNFSDAYPTAKVLRLEQNYRSLGHILAAANGVIACNADRLGKNLWTEQVEGPRIEVREAEDDRAEARWVARQIASLLRSGDFSAGEVAVLMRANHLSMELEQALQSHGQPYVVVRGRSFYDRAEVRDALAYVRLLVNPRDDVAFVRAVNTPSRGVGKTSLTRLQTFAQGRHADLWSVVEAALEAGLIKGRAKKGLAVFKVAFKAATDVPRLVDQVRLVLEAAGVLEALALGGGDDEGRDRFANIERLLVAIATYEEETSEPTLGGFMERVKLVSELDVAALDGGAVSLMTIHAAKGLEFPVVFVMGLEEGLFPHARAIQNDEVEEERRLCYVAITRAERRLFLSRARRRRTFNEIKYPRASRFLAELPPETVQGISERRGARGSITTRTRRAAGSEPKGTSKHYVVEHEAGGEPMYQVGMMVYHAQLGAGRVVRVMQGRRPKLTIRFADVGERQILASYVSPYGA